MSERPETVAAHRNLVASINAVEVGTLNADDDIWRSLTSRHGASAATATH